MARTVESFKRKDSRFQQLPTVLVLCEDLKSGKIYLDDAAAHFRANAKVQVAHCGVTHPLGIVEEAVERQRKFDRIFCAIDRDTHDSFDEALLLASRHQKITVIPSYPCFEFWLLLHYGFNRRPYTSAGRSSAGARVASELKTKPGMEDYEKGAPGGYFKVLLGTRFDTARRCAPQVKADAIRSGELNPSTDIHLLMDEFERLGTPGLIS